ncbi:MAG: peroxiredoxin [Bdellovibrionota bacterium]
MASKKKKKKSAKKTTKKSASKKVKLKGKKKVKKVLKKKSKKTAPKKSKKTTAKKTAKKAVKKATKKKPAAKKTKKAAPKKKITKAKLATPKKIIKENVTPSIEVEVAPLLPDIGSGIPQFTLETTIGSPVNLNELAENNANIVLYFYPKDDTPGCTQEACDFRDNLNILESKGALVVGVSPDSKESHQNFANKYNLNFPLLADPEHELAETMGVWKSKQFMGNTYMGVERSTFLYKNGKLAQIWSPVKVEGHVAEIIEALENNA